MDFPALWAGYYALGVGYAYSALQHMGCTAENEHNVFLFASPLGRDACGMEVRQEWPDKLASEALAARYRRRPEEITQEALDALSCLMVQERPGAPYISRLYSDLVEIHRTRLPRYSLRLPESETAAMLAEERAKITASGWPRTILDPVLTALGAAETDPDRVPRFADAATLAHLQHLASTTSGVTVRAAPFLEICDAPPAVKADLSKWVEVAGDRPRLDCWGYRPSAHGDGFFWRHVLKCAGYEQPREYPPLIEVTFDLRTLPEGRRHMVLNSWRWAVAPRIQGMIGDHAVIAFENKEEGIFIIRVVVPSVLEAVLRQIHGFDFQGLIYASRFSTSGEICDDIDARRHRVALLWRDTPFEDYVSNTDFSFQLEPPANVTVHDLYHAVDKSYVSSDVIEAVRPLINSLGEMDQSQKNIGCEAACRLVLDMETSRGASLEGFIEEKVIAPLFLYCVYLPKIQSLPPGRDRFVFFWNKVLDRKVPWRDMIVGFIESSLYGISLRENASIVTVKTLQTFRDFLFELKASFERNFASPAGSEVPQAVVKKWLNMLNRIQIKEGSSS